MKNTIVNYRASQGIIKKVEFKKTMGPQYLTDAEKKELKTYEEEVKVLSKEYAGEIEVEYDFCVGKYRKHISLDGKCIGFVEIDSETQKTIRVYR